MQYSHLCTSKWSERALELGNEGPAQDDDVLCTFHSLVPRPSHPSFCLTAMQTEAGMGRLEHEAQVCSFAIFGNLLQNITPRLHALITGEKLHVDI